MHARILAASSHFNRRASTMNCHVRNLSPAGAKVAFTSAVDVPDQFDLTIGRKERSFRARMVWRGINEAGVAFLEESIATGVVPLKWAKRLHDCEAENATLRRRIELLTESGAI